MVVAKVDGAALSWMSTFLIPMCVLVALTLATVMVRGGPHELRYTG